MMKRKPLRRMLCAWVILCWIAQAVAPAQGAYNTVPTKKYPTLDQVEMVTNELDSFELHLKFSNNVGCIDETQEGRYDMTGYNEANLTKFHLHDAENREGDEIPITVTPHPEAAKHTDESKYFYIYATDLEPGGKYILTVDEDLYANMGNSLGVSYEVSIDLSQSPQVTSWGPTGELPTSDVIIQPLYLKEASLENDQVDVPVDASITMTFAYNVSGPEMVVYNESCFFLFQGTESVPILVEAGETVNDFILTPVAPLQEGTEYKIVVIKELTARNGSNMSSPVNLYFTTAVSEDPDPSPSVSPSESPDPSPSVSPSESPDPSPSVSPSESPDPSPSVNPSESPDPSPSVSPSESPDPSPSPSQEPVPDDFYFSDLSGNWAAKEINQLAEWGGVAGYPDGRFGPNDTMTRGELVTILVRLLSLEGTETNVFSDTETHWAKREISVAVEHGIANGVGGGKFAPNEQVTREQAVTMIARIQALKSDLSLIVPVFTDSSKISSWAKEAVGQAAAAGIVKGYPDGSFGPQNALTRAEACKILYEWKIM